MMEGHTTAALHRSSFITYRFKGGTVNDALMSSFIVHRSSFRSSGDIVMLSVPQAPIVWQSYLPYHVVGDLLRRPAAGPLGREQRFEAVALFADVAGFTAISEALG